MALPHVPDLHIKSATHHFLEAWRHQAVPVKSGDVVDGAFDYIIGVMNGRPVQPYTPGEPRSFNPKPDLH